MIKRSLPFAVIACALLCTAIRVDADTTVTVDPGAGWVGFMNVFEIPSHGGAYVFGSGWGTADLVATYTGPDLTLKPNSIGDPNPFWYTPSGGPGSTGNKIMDANMYVEPVGSLPGQLVTFTGRVLSNTLLPSHTSVAFVKDFAPDFSSFNQATVALPPGVFSVSLATIADPARHVQYGFETIGPDVWITDVGPYGSVKLRAIPEPASFALMALGVVGIGVWRRQRAVR